MSWPVLPLGLLGSQASTSDNDTYQVSRSLRFNVSDSTYLSRTPASSGNRKTWTFSAWVKRSTIGSAQANYILGSAQAPSGTNGVYFGFGSDTLFFGDYATSGWDWYLQSSSLFRDTSAWYHVVAQYDSTQATASERAKLYVNGVRLTAFDGASTYPGPSADSRFNQASVGMAIGRLGTYDGNYFNGYIAEVQFIDGQALTPSSFGETDATTGRWKAKAFTGTYGVNGFYLPFSNTTTGSNSVLFSEDFSAAMYPKDASSVTTNTTTAPNGATTADTFTENSATATHRFYFNNLTYTNGVTFTSSIYVKANTRSAVALENWNGTVANYCFADLSNGTIISGSHASAAITSVGNGWYRISVSNVGTGAAACGSAFYIMNNAIAGSLSYTGNGTGSIFIWGLQTEASSTVGPYFATNGTAIGSTLLLGADASVSTGGYNNWVANNLSVTPGTGNDSLVDSPTNFGSISTTLVDDTYQISKSLRFNSADSAFLTRTPSVASNRTTWTWSGWVKRSSLGGAHILMEGGSQGTTDSAFYFDSNNNLDFFNRITTSVLGRRITSQVFRDIGSWFHLVVVWDSANATASERIRIYVNGSQITSFSSQTNPGPSELSSINNTVLQKIGATGASTPTGGYFGGYLAEVHFVDGQALTPSSFGTRDVNTYLWKPKAYTGTYGTNGFYLPFTNQGTTQNLLTHSEDFSNAAWTKHQSTVTVNAAVAPNGTTTADKLIETATVGDHQLNRAYTAVDNTTYTLSAYAKAGERTVFRLYLQNKAGTYNFSDFDVVTGTIPLTSGVVPAISAVGDGWYRCSVTANAGTGAFASPLAILSYGTGTAGSGTNGLFVWGAQLEASSSTGPYMVTGASAQTSTLAIGADASVSTGGYNNWVANNLSVEAGVGNDSLVDSPTYYGTDNGAGGEARGDYCTLDPLSITGGTFTNGNLRYAGPGDWRRTNSTMSMSAGKWYFEVTLANAPYPGRTASTAYNAFGLSPSNVTNSSIGPGSVTDALVLFDSGFFKNFAGATTDGGTAFLAGDVLSVSVDLDANTFVFRRNNVQITSGTIGGTPGRSLTPCILSYSNEYGVMDVNFGQRPFIHAAPSGFKALRDYNKLPVPTGGEVRGNYATLNPLDFSCPGTISNGNLQYVQSTLNPRGGRSTMAVSSGKWYWEVTNNGGNNCPGIIRDIGALTSYIGSNADGWGYFIDGQKYNNGTGTNYGASYTTNDVIGIALNMDAGTLVFYKNGVSQGTAFSGLSGTMSPAFSSSNGSAVSFTVNFGQRPWAYDAPFGFKPLCTTLLPQPTIQKSSTAMDVVTYTGNSGTQTISSLGFSPDLVWLKRRNLADSNGLFDSVRGAGWRLQSNDTTAEVLRTDVLTSFDSNGFSITGSDTQSNFLNSTYVAWAWDAGSSSATNTSGSITSTVRANPIAGVSVVTYAGNSTGGATIGHGLGASPKLIIFKCRNFTYQWLTYHGSLPNTSILALDSTAAAAPGFSTFLNSTNPSSTVVTLGSTVGVNESSRTYVAYCFAEVEGFSKIGSYTGNGSADGPFVYCGFRPRWIMYKRTDTTGNWNIIDTARDTYNPEQTLLRANLPNPDESNAVYAQDFTANGWKIRSTNVDINVDTKTYIFAAFAESPFKYARAR